MKHTLTEYFTGQTADYAEKLIADGITVYVSSKPYLRIDDTPIPAKDFFYEVDGYFGYYHEDYFGECSHSMPITPSRAHGNMLHMAPNGEVVHSVAMARRTAREENHGPYVPGIHKNRKPDAVIHGRVIPFVRSFLPGTRIEVPEETLAFVKERIARDFGDGAEPLAFQPVGPTATGWIDLIYYTDDTPDAVPRSLVLAIDPDGVLQGTTTLEFPEG